MAGSGSGGWPRCSTPRVPDWRPYAEFAARNPAFLQRTMVRAISYWNEYYRGYLALRQLAA